MLRLVASFLVVTFSLFCGFLVSVFVGFLGNICSEGNDL